MLCSALPTLAGQHYVREGTDDEYATMGGLVEGTTACRRMPALIEQVLKGREALIV